MAETLSKDQIKTAFAGKEEVTRISSLPYSASMEEKTEKNHPLSVRNGVKVVYTTQNLYILLVLADSPAVYMKLFLKVKSKLQYA